MRPSLSVRVFFDFVCPWCAVGMRQLETALAALRHERPGLHCNIAWHSFPLIPEIPRAGVSSRAFYRDRLKDDAAIAARQAQVRTAGRAVGIDFAFDRIEVMPNTLAAHRLARHIAHLTGDARPFIAALFEAYFVRGEHIGAPSVLARIAARCGIDDRDCAQALLGSPEQDAVLLGEREVWSQQGVHGVPHFLFNGRSMAGVREAGALGQAMRQALDPAV